jgi:hypothetical protein
MRKWLSLLLVLTVGCLETTGLSISSCPGPAGGPCGTFAADFTVPGASLVLHLGLQQDVLSGTGTYSIEAGRSGNLAVTGTYQAPAVSMKLTYDYGPVAQFTGTMTPSHQIVGSFVNDSGQAVSLTFSPR